MKHILIPVLLTLIVGNLLAVDPPKPYGAVPSERQLNWHEMEIYSMLNFSTITYYGKEWGYGDEDPKMFNPTDFDAKQIVRVAKGAGIKGIVIDAKHHGGFCLWPSKYNKKYSVKNSPWRNGKGDMLKEIADACREEGLEVGVYLSPWDRNHKDYGTDAYLTYYENQLREVLTNYGPIFQVWLDGANGGDGYYGGTREMRRVDQKNYYPVQKWFALIRELQPNAVIFSDMGPDVRWNGNEHGVSAETCWATIDGVNWAESNVNLLNQGKRDGCLWIPAEADFPLRLHPKGWFWHPGPPNTTASVEELVDIYFNSVGRNSSMDIGIAPDRRGLMCDEDIASLQGFGEYIRRLFAINLAKGAAFSASNTRGNDLAYAAKNAFNGKINNSYWATDDSIKTAELIIDLGQRKEFNVVSIREYIQLGQRIDDWGIDVWQSGKWYEIGRGCGIGARRLWRGPATVTDKIRFRVINASACPAITEFGVFLEPK